MANKLRGLIVRTQSGFYTVKIGADVLTCRLRGRLKKGDRLGDVVAVGDWVQVTPLDEENGVIEEVEPRLRMFSRMAPSSRGVYQQILIANPDQVVLVFACAEPAPRLGMLDRFLVIAESQAVPVVILANKVDLVKPSQAKRLFVHYARIGYKLMYTSAETYHGVEALKKQLVGKLSLFTGPSGVGKSSLLNVIQPGLGLSVRRVSEATSKGRHATVVREMFPLQDGGYVADTPGLKALALWDIEPEELDGYFPEMRDLVGRCRFSDCTHLHEPDCAVLQALEQGFVHEKRYQSYLRMRFGEDDLVDWDNLDIGE